VFGAVEFRTGGGMVAAGAGVLVIPGNSEPAGAPVTGPGASDVNGGHCVPSGRTVSGGSASPGGVASTRVAVVTLFCCGLAVVLVVVVSTRLLTGCGVAFGSVSTYMWFEIPLGVAIWTSMTAHPHGCFFVLVGSG
jgi:hypothetical protein